MRGFILLFFIFFGISVHGFTESKVDSLLHLLEMTEISDESKLYEIHSELGKAYKARIVEKYDLSGHHYALALKIATKQNDLKKISENLFGIGQSHQRRNNYKEALEHYYKIINFDDSQIDLNKARVYTEISSIYQALGDYQKAFESQMKALFLYEVKDEQLGVAHSNYNLGTIFYYQKQYERSLEHYKKAKIIVDLLKNEKFNYSCVAALGTVYEKLEDNEKSLSFNQLALQIAENQTYQSGVAYAKGNLAMNYLKKGEFDIAEKLLIESIRIKDEIGDRYGKIGNGIDLSELYMVWGKPNKAIPILKNALKIAIELESRTRQSEIYITLANVYDQIKETNEAHNYMKRYVALKDSLLNDKMVEEMGQSQKRYEVEKKEHEIEILKKENELLGKNKKIQQLQFIVFSISSLGFLLFSWWFRNRLVYQRKTNKILEEKNEEIQVQNDELQLAKNELVKTNQLLEDNNLLLEEKNEEIQVQNVELKYTQDALLSTNVLLENNNLLLEEKNELLNGKNEEIRIKNKQLEYSNQDLQQFAYVASHDLKEPLRMINSYTKLLEKRYNDLFDESGKEFMFFVTDAVKRMGVLLDDLLDFSRAGSQEAPTNFISLENVMVLAEANLRHQMESLNAKLEVNFENLPAVKAHQTQLIQLLQNLVSNGVKFKGERDPLVIVDCEKREKEYVISVKDNGIGISDENKKKVFEMFKRLHTRDEYEGTGIGLATCKRIVTSWGGDIWVESEVGEGSTFFFSIPSAAALMPEKKEQWEVVN